MSHFSAVKSQLRRKSNLVSALETVDNGRWKGCVEVHEEPTNLYGYQGDKRSQKAEIIIRRKNVGGSSNDIGFKQQEDGTFSAIISEYDSSRYNTNWMNKLCQTYSKDVVTQVAQENGFNFECTEENGELFVNCERSF